MRRWLWLGTLMCAMSACESEEEEKATVTVATGGDTSQLQPVVPVATVEPLHGGTVVVTGDRYPVEVVLHASGQVYAYLLGDAPPPPETVELTIEVPVEHRATGRPVRMRWDARDGRWEGRVRRVQIIEGPVDVLIVVGGVEYHGHVDVCILLPAIEVHVIRHRGKHKHKHKHKHKRRGRGWRRGHVHIH